MLTTANPDKIQSPNLQTGDQYPLAEQRLDSVFKITIHLPIYKARYTWGYSDHNEIIKLKNILDNPPLDVVKKWEEQLEVLLGKNKGNKNTKPLVRKTIFLYLFLKEIYKKLALENAKLPNEEKIYQLLDDFEVLANARNFPEMHKKYEEIFTLIPTFLPAFNKKIREHEDKSERECATKKTENSNADKPCLKQVEKKEEEPKQKTEPKSQVQKTRTRKKSRLVKIQNPSIIKISLKQKQDNVKRVASEDSKKMTEPKVSDEFKSKPQITHNTQTPFGLHPPLSTRKLRSISSPFVPNSEKPPLQRKLSGS